MSNTPNSWEDAAGDDEQLANQTEQLNIQQQQQGVTQHQSQPRGQFRPSYNAPTFNPGASAFTPTAPAFVPGNSGFSQFGYNQYGQGLQQYDYPQYSQYGGYPQYGGYNASYNQYQQSQQAYIPPHLRQQQYTPQQQPQIAKRPPAGPSVGTVNAAQSQTQKPTAPATTAPKPSTSTNTTTPGTNTTQPGAPKVLSIGGTSSSALATKKDDAKPAGAPVLTIGASASTSVAPSNKTTPSDKAEAGNKATAAKAISASQPPSVSASGKTSPAPSGKSSPAPAAQSATERAAQRREADAVKREQEEAVDDATIDELYGKEHVNIIFIGHVDAGKSSLGGAVLYATGMVDERTMDKYKKEAKDQGRESWYLSWALDLTKEERSKGKTVEVGRGFFETEKRRYTILDAPGHKSYVPSMIGGASQADVGILVISARKGEYETGFERGGQTREHAVLAKTQGVNKLVVVVNKMDDPTVEWSKERYEECITKLTQFLKATGYNPKTDLMFMPISALTGLGLKERIPKKICRWYDGPSLLEYLDNMKTLERKLKAPFMMPVSGKYKEMGTVIEGKIESGVIKKGQTVLIMPGKISIEVLAIYSETEEEIPHATCGDQVRLRVKGVEEEDVLAGYVLTSTKSPVHCVSQLEAQIHIIDLKNILSAGFSCVMHVHTTIQEVTFTSLLHKLEKGTGRKSKKPPPFASKGQAIIALLESSSGTSFPVERYEDYPQLGRFTLRDQGQTIAIGKVTRLIQDNANNANAG